MAMLAESTLASTRSGSSYYLLDHSDIEAVQDAPTLDRGSRLLARGMQFQVSGMTVDWLPSAVARINQLLSLKSGWDGDGSPAVNLDSAKWTLQLSVIAAAMGTVVPSIVPDANGELQLEWHFGDMDVEIVAQSQGLYEVMLEDRRTGEDWEAEGGPRSTALRMALVRVAQRTRPHE